MKPLNKSILSFVVQNEIRSERIAGRLHRKCDLQFDVDPVLIASTHPAVKLLKSVDVPGVRTLI